MPTVEGWVQIDGTDFCFEMLGHEIDALCDMIQLWNKILMKTKPLMKLLFLQNQSLMN
jgi:hypothetical protein